jgi:hypothetical protein
VAGGQRTRVFLRPRALAPVSGLSSVDVGGGVLLVGGAAVGFAGQRLGAALVECVRDEQHTFQGNPVGRPPGPAVVRTLGSRWISSRSVPVPGRSRRPCRRPTAGGPSARRQAGRRDSTFPSTAIAGCQRRPATTTGVARARSQRVNTTDSTSASIRISSRHTVVAAGTRSVNPSRLPAGQSRSRIQSVIAANVVAPASTAHTDTASMLNHTDPDSARTPRSTPLDRLRGSPGPPRRVRPVADPGRGAGCACRFRVRMGNSRRS